MHNGNVNKNSFTKLSSNEGEALDLHEIGGGVTYVDGGVGTK